MRQILHLSDIHFGPYHRPAVATGVLALVAAQQPDLVVVSGDLTQRAKARQFREARAFVDQIAALGIATLVVPGNHDVPAYRLHERALDPYGAYRQHFSPELEPELEEEELLVIGINTAHGWTRKEGRIRRRRLRAVASRLRAADPARIPIIVAHHQLVPPPWFESHRVLGGAHDAIELFSRLGVEMVLSGHLHQTFVGLSETYYPLGRSPVLLVHTGTSTSGRGRGSERNRNTCNWIRIDSAEVEITQLGWEEESQAFAAWSRHLFPRRGRQAYALTKTLP